MELSVPDRIQIMPVGHEVKRVTRAAEKFKPDKVILITHHDNDKTAEDCLSEIKQHFEENEIEYDNPRQCNIFDLYSSLGEIAEAIYEHQDDDIYVNTATGSKITAIAGMIASMVTEATAYYVHADNYDNFSDGNISFEELPRYPIDHPEIDQIATMEYIRRMEDKADHTPTKGELIQFADANNFSYMNRNVAGKGKYRLLDKHIIKPLDDEGYIETMKEGRSTLITLTDTGRNAVQAYQYLIPDMEDLKWDPSQQIVNAKET